MIGHNNRFQRTTYSYRCTGTLVNEGGVRMKVEYTLPYVVWAQRDQFWSLQVPHSICS